MQGFSRYFETIILEEFVIYFQYCRGLQFEDKPDYNYIRSLFKTVFDKFNYEYDFQYDWNLIFKNKEDEENKSDYNKNTREGIQRVNF